MRPGTLVLMSLVASAAVAPVSALAIRPNFDGERGLELQIALGAGSYFDTTTRWLQRPRELPPGVQPMPMLSPGFHFRAAVGWRFFPLLSAGVYIASQTLGSTDISSRGMNLAATAGAVSAGVYTRFYPMPLFIRTLNAPRTIFQSAGEARRFEPWISIGFEFYQNFWRTTERSGLLEYSRWNVQGVGVPVAVGFDFRVLEPLAVGISFGVAPWITFGDCGNMDQPSGCPVQQTVRTITADGNPQTDLYSYNSAAGTNVSWFLGLGVRYTLSP